ncbi:MAG TPA: DUF2520 domain-containing protein [Solirubrobacteraceae bacterium]|nr:DUF2520 domain-containing protein [Solirubrobacteraceae bacterium]
MTDTQTPLTPRAEARIPDRIAIVGAGRLGTALAAALAEAGIAVEGPLRRGESVLSDPGAVLLCVPDAEIEAAAAALAPGPLVGHCSASTTLAVLAPHEAFSLHPLMTVPDTGATFAGATAAIAGATDRALRTAEALARRLGMRAVHVDDADRAAYHAAASVAANFLVVVEDLAERLARSAGIDREPLVALVQAAVANWATLGPGALTGPVARGDDATVERQRAAVAERAPDDLALFDALVDAGRRLAAASQTVPA